MNKTILFLLCLFALLYSCSNDDTSNTEEGTEVSPGKGSSGNVTDNNLKKGQIRFTFRTTKSGLTPRFGIIAKNASINWGDNEPLQSADNGYYEHSYSSVNYTYTITIDTEGLSFFELDDRYSNGYSTELYFGECPELKTLKIYGGGELEKFDFSKCTNIVTFVFERDPYYAIPKTDPYLNFNLNTNPNITSLTLNNSRIKSLNIEKLTKLKWAYLFVHSFDSNTPIKNNNLIEKITLGRASKYILDEETNYEPFKSILIDSKTKLTSITIKLVKTETLKISKTPALKEVEVRSSSFKNFDISEAENVEDIKLLTFHSDYLKFNANIQNLDFESTSFNSDTLDLSLYPQIGTLKIESCNFTKLNIEDAKHLQYISISGLSKMNTLKINGADSINSLKLKSAPIKNLELHNMDQLEEITLGVPPLLDTFKYQNIPNFKMARIYYYRLGIQLDDTKKKYLKDLFPSTANVVFYPYN